MKLVAASAVMCGRTAAHASDLWVLRYVWDRAEQIGPLAGMVQGLLEKQPAAASHPLSPAPESAEGEEVARQLDAVASALKEKPAGLAALARWVVDSIQCNRTGTGSGSGSYNSRVCV